MSIDYREYIKSESWLETAGRTKKRDSGCLVCRRRTWLDVHHGTYRHLGEELDCELFTLCRFHHRELHDRFGRARRRKEKVSLLSFTRRFIERKAKPPAEEAEPEPTGKRTAFDGVIAMVASRFPKEGTAAKETVRFRGRNELIAERLMEMRNERLERRRLRRNGLGPLAELVGK